MSGIYKVVKSTNGYFTGDNRTFQNKELSFAARGLLAYLISKPPNWETRNADLINASPASKYAVQTLLKELKQAGHMRRVRTRGVNNKFNGWDTTIYELAEHNPDYSPDTPVIDSSGSPDTPVIGLSGNSTVQPLNRPKTGVYNKPDRDTKTEITKKEKQKEQQQSARESATQNPCCCLRPLDSCDQLPHCKYLSEKAKLMWDYFAYKLKLDNQNEKASLQYIIDLLRINGATEDTVAQSISYGIDHTDRQKPFSLAYDALTKGYFATYGKAKTWADVNKSPDEPVKRYIAPYMIGK